MADTKLKTSVKDKVKGVADRLLPEDLREILDAVNGELDWAILSVLESGKKSYPKIVEELGLEGKEKVKFNKYLEKLLNNGIVTHFYYGGFFKKNSSIMN